jgi:hypothetical protein
MWPDEVTIPAGENRAKIKLKLERLVPLLRAALVGLSLLDGRGYVFFFVQS